MDREGMLDDEVWKALDKGRMIGFKWPDERVRFTGIVQNAT
jgi:hypothetical protein